MIGLRKNEFICFLSLVLVGCKTPAYKIFNQKGLNTELLVSPERILLECEDVQDKTEKTKELYGRYGFMIHILDDKNTVLTVVQGNVLGKKGCFDRISKIGKILKNGKKIYVGGTGELKEPRKEGRFQFTFPGVGTFYSNSRTLGFSVIMNDRGECYSAYEEDEKPCPRDEFPIQKLPF